MATMADVARAAGLSRYTVSKALNGDRTVRPAARERILAVCRRLDYTPNPHAVGLVRGRANLLGLIVSQITDPFYGEIIEAADRTARGRGTQVVVQCSYGQAALEEQILRNLLALRVRGLVVAPVMSGENRGLWERAERAVPVVFIDRFFKRKCHYVMNDHYKGARLVTEHLLERRRPAAYLGSAHGRLNSAIVDRERGYLDAAAARGARPVLIPLTNSRAGRDTEEFGYENMKAHLREAPPPPALFCATDAIALGAMLALSERGLRPGKDVLVAGHDDLPFSAYANPPLTTVRQPKEEIGRRAVEAALELARRRRKGEFVRKVLPPDLVVRASTNPGPGGSPRRALGRTRETA